MASSTTVESPVKRANRLRFTPGAGGLSDNSRENLRRVATKLTPTLVEILDREMAPLYVCRRVAWGQWTQDRFVRLALAMHLRRPANPHAPSHSTSGWAWPKDREASAAERVFRASPQYARLVKADVLVEHGKIPLPHQMQAFAMSGQRLWSVIWNEVTTIDRAAFLEEVTKLVAARRRRRSPKKRKPLSRDQVAILDALKTLSRAVVDGRLTADALPGLADGTPARAAKRSAGQGRRAVA